MTKINLKIISKPHAHLQTLEKCDKSFQKTGIKLYEELRSQGTHCLYTFIESEVRKYARIISKAHAHCQTMEKICAKFQKDWYKIV